MTEMKKIWDNYKEVADIQKSDAIKFVVAAAVRDGVKYVNIREFYKRKTDEKWMPGRDGITIPLEVPVNKGANRLHVSADLSAAIAQAIGILADLPLADPANAVYIEKKERV